MSKDPKFRRVLLKISGEGLMGDGDYGLDPITVDRIAIEIKSVRDLGAQVGVVVGGGNIFRGIEGASRGMDRAAADNMGMLATTINALALQNALEQIDVSTRVQSAIVMPTVCEPFIRRRALRHMEKGRVVIFAAGTGNPFFTTDTAAALRAAEMGCNVLLKATQVDGVYTADPKKDPKAERYDHLTFKEMLARDLKVMDTAAVALCRENNVPILVFNLHQEGAFAQVVQGKGRFTLIEEGKAS
jgi:uridylate kinase